MRFPKICVEHLTALSIWSRSAHNLPVRVGIQAFLPF